MGFSTGRNGSLRFGGKPVAKVRDWSLDTTVNLLSTDTIDSNANTFVPGIKGATGSATLLYYKLENGESGNYTEFTALLAKIMKADPAGVGTGAITTDDRVFLELNAGGGSKDNIKCYAYITSARISAGTGELNVVPINFTVDGDFTEVLS